MCQQYKEAQSVLINYIVNKDVFTLKEIKDNIIEKTGYWISSNATIYDYLKKCEKKGYIKYIPRKKEYINCSKVVC